MKIAMIGQKGIPTLFGGIERHVEELSCHLASQTDCRVFVYARSYYTPRRLKRYKKVRIIHLPSLRTKHLDAASHTFLASWHALFKLKADLIHYHGVGPALFVWLPKLLRPRTKVVFTFHCRDYFHKKWGKLAQLSLKLGESIGCRLADQIIVVSEELKDYVQKKYGQEAHFIPHGIRRENNQPAKKIKRWGLKKNNYLLIVSRLIPHKGIHYLIKAYQQIQTDKKLVIVGPSFYTAAYEKKIKAMIKNNQKILCLGSQQGQTLKELYSNAYCFINPSEQEGLPLAVLEAASFGRILLLSDIDIHKNMLANWPFFFRNKSIKSLKNNLEFILENRKSIQSRGSRIKRYSRQKYDWSKVVEKTVLIYS